ncbi:uncharacterized protein MKK02DRAFT_19921 [Dioszegia hungarica]|uniref:CUE domain-containing protein n=1 Tax=Dioszegia hungarica TaxID=4972 RepID=A0AA38H2T6_9TREE|nr:uncharacterized protein MKK02DRAFT_19921 [Dioszegia hungarica]KAI9632885.1 hypothetical protein MKK02DRAFT_19921 [Dioszegia hungarica]
MSTPPPTSTAAPLSPARTISPAQTTTPSYAPPTTRPPPPAPAPALNMHSDPKVAELQTMFPSVDPGVIEIVLESVSGSQDRAIEQLLSITDENFKAEEDQQVDLDAEFARSLQLEDEQSARQYADQNQGYTGGQAGHTNPGAGGLPYQARVRRNQPSQQGQAQTQAGGYGGYENERYSADNGGPPPGVGVGMLQVEEKLQKAAEVGKQTFNNLFSLAKTKYAEFQQTQAQNQSQQTQGQHGSSSGGGLWGGEQAQQSPSAAGWGRGGAGGAGSRGGVQNYGYGQQGQQGLGMGTRSESFSSESTNEREMASDPRPVIRPSSNRWTPSDTYEDPLPPGRSTPTGNRGISMNPTGRAVGSPEGRGTAKIDASKLGILPKKKVDLLSSSPNSSTTIPSQTQPKQEVNLLDDHGSSDPNPGIPGASHSVISKIPPTPPGRARGQFELEDSDDELEYTKNPFDEK